MNFKKHYRTSEKIGAIMTALSLFFITVIPANAESEKQYQSQIKKIAKEIKQISKNLNANKKLLKSEQHKLLEVEKKIITLQKSSEELEKKKEEQQRLIAETKQQIDSLIEEQSGNIEGIKNLVTQQYINGQPNYLKMVLNQQNPYAVGRLSHYYKYYQQAHNQKLTLIGQQLSSLEQLEAQNKAAIKELESLQNQQNAEKKELQAAQNKRKQTISRLDKKVENSSAKLKKLKQDRGRLNKLLKQLAKQAEEMRRLEKQRQQDLALKKPQQSAKPKPILPIVKGGFKKQKGRLNLPVKGKLQYKFGSRIASSGMRAEGLFIETKKDESVKTIFRGRVVFADWLKGYGLLIIVDHGDDHISLYGHNELLYKKVGDMVETNETIAKAGTTGGLKKTGVYFEIRHNATPINPSLWCN